jgi:hypothetical protein
MTAPKPEHPDALTAWLDPDSGVLYFSQAGGRNAATYLLKSAVEKRERALRDALAACVEVMRLRVPHTMYTQIGEARAALAATKEEKSE